MTSDQDRVYYINPDFDMMFYSRPGATIHPLLRTPEPAADAPPILHNL